MSWFNSGIANFAKTALTQAQKTIDRALDIQDSADDKRVKETNVEAENFFASFGIEPTLDPTSSSSQPRAEKLADSLWGSFSGSFFETVNKSQDENSQSPRKGPSTKTESDPDTISLKITDPKLSEQSLSSISDNEFTEVSLLPAEDETISQKDEREKRMADPDIEPPQHEISQTVKEEIKSEISLVSSKSLSSETLDKSTDSSKTITQEFEDTDAGSEDAEEEKFTNFPLISALPQTCITENQLENKDACNQEQKNENLNISIEDKKLVQTTEKEESKECRDVETKSTDSYNSSTGSFIKCMIDEAIRDQETGRSHSPHSTTSSDKSDMVKLESEQNSGQTSGDEVETTTSSDVEIISISSPNGDNLEKTSLSPMKQVWSGKGPSLRRGERSESPSSDCSSIKAYPRAVGHRKHAFEGIIESDKANADSEKLLKKVGDLSEILHARETKLLELSRENVQLQETNNALKIKLKHSQEVHAADTKDVTSLTEELSQRLSTMERNLQQALTEKESLKTEVQKGKEEIATRLCAKQVEEIIKEKDTQIQELMQEGEKLSKQELQQSNIIKKLRAKEKETTKLIQQQKQKLEDQSDELERVRKALTAKEDIERKQIDAIRQLTNTVQKQEKDLAALTIELSEGQDKTKSQQTNLDELTNELADLRRINVEKETLVQEAALSAEMAAKEELQAHLERVQKEARLTQEGLLIQIEDLRLSLGRSDNQASRREDMLKQEISDLQQRLQEAEARTQELTQSVSIATRPLLRQIENLQATFNNQSSTWEQVEASLTERLSITQSQLSVSVEKERSISEKYREVSNKLCALEAQNDLLKQEKSRLQVQLETQQTKLAMHEEWKEKELVQKEKLKQTYADEISSLKREQKMLEHQLDIEKTVVEAEKRKCVLLQDQLKEKERKLSIQAHETSNRDTPSPTPSLSRFSSVSESYNPWLHEDILDQSLIMTSSTNGSKLNLYEALRHNGATSLLENLQSQLKMREGEIVQLQNEIAQLERVRESMAAEMVQLTTCNEELDEELKQLQEEQANFHDMQKKYNALLQMYGEKVEEADELRLDLIDVKEMYKAQITELLKKS